MIEVLREYLPAILIAVLIGIIVGFLVFRPRQNVRLTDNAPVRPHMAHTSAGADSPLEGNGIADEAAAAASDVSGEIVGADVHAHLGDVAPDNLQRLKGVGPKLAGMLQAHGITRFEQIARLTPEQAERLDADLGAFKGRIGRDRIIEQAAFLARGDEDGFQQHFGKL
jgi:predicted flap endonuclease-1-like 5' DNA nuclease